MTTSVLARFERKDLDAAAIAQIESNTVAFRAFAEQVLAMAPAGRELSCALTALEETKFWTNQAIATAYPAATATADTSTGDDTDA